MSGIEIALLIAGGIIFFISFFLPGKKNELSEGNAGITEEQAKYLVEKEINEAKNHINEVIDETITYNMEKAERAMERITNEKMLAVNEYSDTVLDEINKNQQEVVFLYDMLNEKQQTLKDLASQAAVTATELQKKVRNAEEGMADMNKAGRQEVMAGREPLQLPAVRRGGDQAAGLARGFRSFNPERVEWVQTERMPEQAAALTGRMSASAHAAKENNKSKKYAKRQNSGKDIDAAVSGSQEKEYIDIISAEYQNNENTAWLSADMIEVSSEDKYEAYAFADNVNRGSAAQNSLYEENMFLNQVFADNKYPDQVSWEAHDDGSVSPDTPFAGDDGTSGSRNNNEKILELHKIGQSNIDIAKKLSLGIGEVKLVIDLYEGAN